MENTKSEKPVSHARRDRLLEIEKQVQKRWAEAKIFEADAPSEIAKEGEKFFGNFPFPYMNGTLHLGHAFSVTKLEFAAAYHRLRGKNVLFPFGFHCTGMPIKACADKIAREIEAFGNPPVFPSTDSEALAAPVESGEEVQRTEPQAFKSKKSKQASKTGGIKYQWEIMRSLGLKDDEISKFKDPIHWLKYFPPVTIEDLKALGLSCDWRRSFITTDYNPYYDSFVRWQMCILKDSGKIVMDTRYAVYSPLDGQPCADHDRQSGEGVQPYDYTLIKMKVKPPFTGKLKALDGKDVYLAAATLRPETMYGQTNAWVLPEGEYGAFEVNADEVFVVTKRAALNMSYQNLSKVPQNPTCLLELLGRDLIGLPLISPMAINPVIYVLPLLTVLTTKGTGIVTSVPSDAPDDYMGLSDLKSKPGLREKYGVKDEWVLPFEIIPIIHIPEYGDKAAEKICRDLKIVSQNDKVKLADAKQLVYLKGFNDGTMLVGDFKGQKVSHAKELVKELLVDARQAVPYSEPADKVMSRSGDECVVALTDQWYLTYGESEWKTAAENCLKRMELYHEETKHGFEHTLGWLRQWALSRSFGLGTQVPWDPQFLVESLSDSTIYMAYYTVAHFLQDGDMYGKSSKLIKAEHMTPAVWDYLFRDGPLPDSQISPDLLQRMKKEFSYWYPFDLRVSGKDLIQNHLTFCLYIHATIFKEKRWPLAYRCNGHLLLNSEKMSKSSGNFKTIRDAVEEFSADATRFALADAGDAVDDANFVSDTANSAILRLTKEMAWIEEVLAAKHDLRTGPLIVADEVFANEINIAIVETQKNYDAMLFRAALKTGFYDLQTAKDDYRVTCGLAGMHETLLRKFIVVQTKLIAPICPHYAEYVWKDLLDNKGFAANSGFPTYDPPDLIMQRANKYIRNVIVDFRKLLERKKAPPKKGEKSGPSAPLSYMARIVVAESYGGWQEECLNILRRNYDPLTRIFKPDQEILAMLKASPVAQAADFKRTLNKCMPFLKFKKDEAIAVGPQALDLTLPFNELKILTEYSGVIEKQLGLEGVEVLSVNDVNIQAFEAELAALRQAPPSPGHPAILFVSSTTDEALQGLHI